MEPELKKATTYLTLRQVTWLNGVSGEFGVLSGKKLKAYLRWSILIDRWFKDGCPDVPTLDDRPEGSTIALTCIEMPLWAKMHHECARLSTEREMSTGVAVLVRSILDYYMHKESSDGFAHRCFEDLPAEPGNPEAPLQGVAGLGRIHQGRNADSGMESAL